jgi:hypothetical protein
MLEKVGKGNALEFCCPKNYLRNKTPSILK